MKQSGHLNPSEETGTGCLVASKYGGVGKRQHVPNCFDLFSISAYVTTIIHNNGNEIIITICVFSPCFPRGSNVHCSRSLNIIIIHVK